MKKFGIIGKPLGHSYSERYFSDMFLREGIDASYHPYTIDAIDEVLPLLQDLDGFNVTYPYKEQILPYLDELDDTAKSLGAVNVVHRSKGYNTDWIGFRDSVHPLLKDHHQRALLLGTGGVSKAIQYALQELGIRYTLVSRKERKKDVIGYDEVNEDIMREHTLIVNCTPLGMHPYEGQKPNIPYQYLTKEHLLYDCIYNPDQTPFLLMGKEYGCTIKNGLDMLHIQARKAWEIWNTI